MFCWPSGIGGVIWTLTDLNSSLLAICAHFRKIKRASIGQPAGRFWPKARYCLGYEMIRKWYQRGTCFTEGISLAREHVPFRLNILNNFHIRNYKNTKPSHVDMFYVDAKFMKKSVLLNKKKNNKTFN